MLSVCDSSLVNGLGYAIDDSAITASSSYSSTSCQPQNARNVDGTSSHAWCSGSSKYYIITQHYAKKKYVCILL